jgi:hypothetical protein
MAQLGAEKRPDSAAASVRVHPIHATVWKRDGKHVTCEKIDDPAGDGLEDLEEASEENVVWIEARLDGLEAGGQAEEWLSGSLEAWDSINTIPQADWGEMSEVLRVVRGTGRASAHRL